ncbi:MAG: recombinase [Lentisphaerae bacterium]|nr:recombinase [Lentisphaerota bacterium]
MNTLLAIQCELKAPKGQKNQFGNFYYRNCEDILFAVKPILQKHDAELYLTDEVVAIGNYVFLKATAMLKIGEQLYISTGYAMLDKDKKGMDAAQITGAASSYARKYALCGLFLIDGGDDVDALCPAPPAVTAFAPSAVAPAPAISAVTPPPPPPKK